MGNRGQNCGSMHVSFRMSDMPCCVKTELWHNLKEARKTFS